jgi:hypothetical protein
MSFQRIGQDWQAKRLFGDDAGKDVLIRSGSWCWLEEREGESGLDLEPGDCLVIEDATALVDRAGEEVPGGLERAERWIELAKRHKLAVPQHLTAKKPRRRRRTTGEERAHG